MFLHRIAPAQRVEGAFRADFDGTFPGLKAWAVLLNRFAVRSNRLVYKDQGPELH